METFHGESFTLLQHRLEIYRERRFGTHGAEREGEVGEHVVAQGLDGVGGSELGEPELLLEHLPLEGLEGAE